MVSFGGYCSTVLAFFASSGNDVDDVSSSWKMNIWLRNKKRKHPVW
jgi:hypothetical protein